MSSIDQIAPFIISPSLKRWLYAALQPGQLGSSLSRGYGEDRLMSIGKAVSVDQSAADQRIDPDLRVSALTGEVRRPSCHSVLR